MQGGENPHQLAEADRAGIALYFRDAGLVQADQVAQSGLSKAACLAEGSQVVRELGWGLEPERGHGHGVCNICLKGYKCKICL